MAGRSSWIQIVVIVLVFAIIFLEFQVLNMKSEKFFEARLEKDLYQEQMDSNREYSIQDTSVSPVVLYNRIPKTGSTSFTNLVYDSCKRNKMYVAHINTTKNSHIMSVQDQYSLIHNITNWQKVRPAFFHGHMAYLDFKHFGSPISPIYINIVRDPLERLVSYYYFLRYGDDYRKGLKRARQGDKTTFDQCVKKRGSDCSVEKLWLQIPFFCGQSAECWNPGSKWALQEAKNNLINNYMLVGLTEQMEEFIVILEATIPKLFHGMTEMYRVGSKSHIRKTLHKETPSDETISIFHKSEIWQMEMELYLFAKAQFEYVKKQSTILDSFGNLKPAPRRFRYEKIHGPNGIIQNR